MSDAFDRLDDEVAEGARSPVSGITSAMAAGEALRTPLTDTQKRKARLELPAYLVIQASWFAAFGLQMVLFPFIIANLLGESPTKLGLAQMALSAPSVVFILFGGVVAERAEGRTILILLHLLAAVPAAALGWWILDGDIAFSILIVYALTMGTIGAFMMPARDAILNEVVERRQASGRDITLQQGVAYASLMQFGAQIAGLAIAGFATAATVGALLGVQAAIVAVGAIAAVFLARGRKVHTGRSGFGAAFGDIADGFRTVNQSPVLFAMTLSMLGVGVFIIGAFLVVLPIVNRDVYGLGSDGIRNMFVIFWFGAFLSSAALSRLKEIDRPGRLMLLAQFLGSACILVMMMQVPYVLFLTIVFLWGLAAGVSITLSRSIVQRAAPPDRLARVLSIYQLGFMGGAPFGAWLMGVLTDVLGVGLIPLVPALGMMILIAYMIAATPIWRMQPEATGVAGDK